MVFVDISTELISRAKEYADTLLREQLPAGFSYHTFGHTEQVVAAATEIGTKSGLSVPQIKLLQLTAWLHDLGYVKKYMGHEEASQEISEEFLSKYGVDSEIKHAVYELIASTKLDQPARNLMEMVLKDADLYNLALPEALENSENIREEWRIFCNQQYTDEEWDQFNFRFFNKHEYLTEYGKTVLGPMKSKNTKKLKKTIKKRELATEYDDNVEGHPAFQGQADQMSEIQKLKKALKKIKKDRPDRGIETMFRTTYRTHINLSSIADNKANILLSINAIIISIIFTSVIKEYDPDSPYLWPSFGILTVCMTTIVFAILATRPKINSGRFTREDILEKRTNLLFFGNFYRMELNDYMWGIQEMMEDADFLYGSLAKDLFFLGKVLAKKFFLLRMAYNIFMYGMAVAIIVFGLVLLDFKS